MTQQEVIGVIEPFRHRRRRRMVVYELCHQPRVCDVPRERVQLVEAADTAQFVEQKPKGEGKEEQGTERLHGTLQALDAVVEEHPP